MTTPDAPDTLKPTAIADGIRRELATIRRHWAGTFDPPRTTAGGAHGVPDSRMPGNDTAISLRAEVTRDLAFWVHAYVDEHPDAVGDWVVIDALDVPRTCRFLTEQAGALGEWDWGNRMWDELGTLAREVKLCAQPPVRDSMMIGECPVEVEGPYGMEPCGGSVRVKRGKDGATCPKCKTWAVIEWWYSQIVGNPEAKELLTAGEIVTIAAFEHGVVIAASTVRKWAQRGQITPSLRTDTKGRAMYPRADALALVARLVQRGRLPEVG